MKSKALTAALVGALLAASVAVAAPADKGGKPRAGTGTTTTTTAKKGPKGDAALLGCAKTSDVELGGTFVSAGTGSFAMLVTNGNRRARELKGKQVTVMTTERTTFRRRGHATLADLVAGDRLRVHARTCRAPRGGDAGAAAATPVFVARKVDAKPAKTTGGTTTTTTSG